MSSESPRKPLPATLRDAAEDRRQNRLALDPCATCGQEVRVMLRTPYVLYMRCERCSAMWTVPKPGYDRQFGT